MKNVRKKIGSMVILFSLFLFFLPLKGQAEIIETPSGIEFYTNDRKTKPVKPNKPEVPKVAENPTIKKGGTLPMTGELMQPIIILLLGWLLLILLAAVYLSAKKQKMEEGER